MPRKTLTNRFVESVKVEKRTDYWDDVIRGLVLRVSGTGIKSWTVVYTPQNEKIKRRFTLGKFPVVQLEKARGLALKTLAAVAEGDDPSDKRRANSRTMTVADLGNLFIEKYSRPNKKTWYQDQRILLREVIPAIGTKKIHSLARRDLLDIVEAKLEAGYGIQSNHILAVMRKMFNWAVDSDYLELSPALGIKPRAKPTPRDRVLSNEEIRTLWTALPGVSLFDDTKSIFKLLLLTGQRPGEICGVRRGEVDLENNLWMLPRERTKNARAHNVPLTEMAKSILENQIEDGMRADAPLFTRVGTPIESTAISQAARKQLQFFDCNWTPHDIRRTVATGMAEIGIQPHIIEVVQNRYSGFRSGVAGVYNRATYDREKRHALEQWTNHLKAIIPGMF